ncbi:LGFP repeat-containing protein [Rhodococcus baikonurensis]|uniref:LGFP repeat-containing protein n=1 Tax=Rhodococcus baikonurensis TaxID=172041 RepID=UPI0037B7F6F6
MFVVLRLHGHPNFGTRAFTVWGAIRTAWANAGWENSFHGYPTGNEYSFGGRKRQKFQYNVIDWNVAPSEQDVYRICSASGVQGRCGGWNEVGIRWLI